MKPSKSKTIIPKSKVDTNDILTKAAELIILTGQKEVSIGKLAEIANVQRAAIHYLFKKGTRIYLQIVEVFTRRAQERINVAVSDFIFMNPKATYMERLIVVFFATLNLFEKEELFGKAVFYQMDVRSQSENYALMEIFKEVDDMFALARKNGELSEAAMTFKDDWKIRQIMFSIIRGGISAIYLGEGKPDGEPDFRVEELKIEVLRIFQIYCNEQIRKKLEEKIQDIRDSQGEVQVKLSGTRKKHAS